MYKHIADSIKESSDRMFISSEEKTKFNNYENIMRRKDDSYSKEEVDNKVNQIKNKLYESVECSHISIDNTLDGYLKDVEILGNTIQDANNLADIRSVGDKVEGQELYEIPVVSCGKNLFDEMNYERFSWSGVDWNKNTLPLTSDGNYANYNGFQMNLKLKPNTTYTLKFKWRNVTGVAGQTHRYIRFQFKDVANKRYSDAINGMGGFDPNTDSHYILFEFNGNSPSFVEKSISFTTPNEVLILGKLSNERCELKTNCIQLEEGTQATPYEPYQEDKLTILSPVQLEKVGDVADRLICKDGVWGVEKNIGTEIFNNIDNVYIETYADGENYLQFNMSFDKHLLNSYKGICDKFINVDFTNKNNFECFSMHPLKLIIFKIKKDKLSTPSVGGFREWCKANPITIKYQLAQPQFIPLPHDQQVKLKTFANKTNISFGCEIEGTIKAQVPKSLGATVNTHTEQINNLNKELDRVKKLEESTVSTVTTESDFTTVEATSNGYFEDVKLEGKTLVNKFTFKDLTLSSNNDELRVTLKEYIYSGVYTVVNTFGKNIMLEVYDKNSGNFSRNITIHSNSSTLVTILENERFDIIKGIQYHGWDVNSEADKEAMKKQLILEGDHTQNPPSYFEGLKSVGQSATTSEDGVDEIVVSSVKGDGNLFEDNVINQTGTGNDANGWLYPTMFKYSKTRCRSANQIKVKPNTDYYFSSKDKFLFAIAEFDSSNRQILENGWTIPVNGGVHRTSSKCESIIVIIRKDDNSEIVPSEVYGNVQIKEGSDKTCYTPHQSDKKRLLYYNNETQTWEKPILREWDSIEKHADGKYYYHQRSAEIVLNGSENWGGAVGIDNDNFKRYQLKVTGIFHRPYDIVIISDKFKSVTNKEWTLEEKKIEADSNFLYITTDILTADEFKQWLQANNVTVVYQLAQEKVYECTNIDLITYANETNYVVECGAISPKSTLKVHNNISNVVNLLQKKVSLLESNQSEYQIAQNRILLNSKYTADRGEFRIDIINETYSIKTIDDIDLDTFYLTKAVIDSGKSNYDRCVMEEIIDFYTLIGKFSFEMADELFDLLYADESYIEE